jgi:UDP-GlcNAc:undecaprenyl-phosphate GlcNAc-1-phosphate transferase
VIAAPVTLILSFAIALCLTAASIPVLLRWSASIGLTDAPGPRKVHSVPTPRIGGIAMAIGILLPTLFCVDLSPRLVGLLAGVAVLLGFGIWDDRRDLDFRLKFFGQALAVGVCMVLGHIRIDAFTLDERLPLPPWVAAPLTFVFLVGVTNAINLADGLDGLAGGMALLCLSAIALLAGHSGNQMVMGLALIEAGAILGFLRFNTHPARCFMGDSGSQVLGFSIGVLSILATQGENSPVSTCLPLLIVGVPILDTLYVMTLRIRAGRSPFAPDRNHLHHRLLGLGLGHAESVAVIYVLQAGAFLLAYALRFESDLTILGAFAAMGLGLLGALRLIEVRGWRLRLSGFVPLAERVQRLRRSPETAAPVIDALRAVAGGAIGLYLLLVVVSVSHIDADVTGLCGALLAILILVWRPIVFGHAEWVERAAAYVAAALLVYLEVQGSHRGPWLAALGWVLVGAITVAALGALVLDARRRFEVTALDLLIVLLAIFIPNLPGGVALAGAQAAGITKGIVLVYAVEMLHSGGLRRALYTGFTAAVFGIVALRGVIAFLP